MGLSNIFLILSSSLPSLLGASGSVDPTSHLPTFFRAPVLLLPPAQDLISLACALSSLLFLNGLSLVLSSQDLAPGAGEGVWKVYACSSHLCFGLDSWCQLLVLLTEDVLTASLPELTSHGPCDNVQ